jgi:GntR family transcriptional regulator
MTPTAPTARREKRRHSARWLRDQLRAEVMRGGFAGGLLPSEAQLMMAYAAPRSLVREALDLLRREGVVERIQGTGTLAVAQRPTARLVEIHGVDGHEESTLPGMSNRVLALEVVPTPRMVAHHLDVRPGVDCLLYEYIGYLYGQTLGVYTNYMLFPEAERVLETPFRADWYTLLRDARVAIGDTELTIELMAADEPLAALLDMLPGRPVLGMQQVIRDEADRPYDYAILRSRGDRISLMSRGISTSITIEKEDHA